MAGNEMTNEEAFEEIKRIVKEPYSEENLKKFKEIMMDIKRWIFLGENYIYDLPRASDEFKILTDYHMKCMEDSNYKAHYRNVVAYCREHYNR